MKNKRVEEQLLLECFKHYTMYDNLQKQKHIAENTFLVRMKYD